LAHASSSTAPSRVICELDLDASGRHEGYLRVPFSRDTAGWGTVEIPIVVINGAHGGARAMFTGGVHGDEYEGQIAVSRLSRTLRDPQSIQGRLILMPMVDLPAALAGRRLCPLDERDLNRQFPGDPRGSFTEVLAHFIDTVLLPRADVLVEVHSGGHGMESALSTNMHYTDDLGQRERQMALAGAFGAPFNVVFWGVDEGATLPSAAERRGMLAIGTELGGWGRVNVEGVRIAERGLANVMKHLGMIDGAPDTAQRDGTPGTRHMGVKGSAGYVFAPADGLFEPKHLAAQDVRAGDLAGIVHFPEDWAREPIELRYRASGVLWMAMGPGRCRKGDVVAVVMEDYKA
jgi:N-alpha-acetyl-L-2,4-diaminobutyrate deacetylase